VHKPLRGRHEIIKRRLTLATLGGVVPFDSKFRSTAYVGQGEQTAVFDQECHQDAKTGRDRNSIAAVSGHDYGTRSAIEDLTLPEKEHRNASAVFGRKTYLNVRVALRADLERPLGPRNAGIKARCVSVDLDRLGKGLALDENFIVFDVARNDSNGFIDIV